MDLMEIQIRKEVKVSLFVYDRALCIMTAPENFHGWKTLEAESKIRATHEKQWPFYTLTITIQRKKSGGKPYI